MIVFFFVPLLETKQSKHQRTHEQQVIHLFLEGGQQGLDLRAENTWKKFQKIFSQTHIIHVWYIYLHLVVFNGKTWQM